MTTIKRFLTLSLIAALAVQVWGVPAYRGWQTKMQPDGTTIIIRQTGDEFFHYWENEEGQQVAKDAQGFWRVLATPAVQSEVSKQKQASRKYCQRGGNSMIRKAAGQINLAPRGLVILVNYSDVTFRSGNTQAAMSDLMNSENYTYNSATGSVREFFKAQSNGAYVPDFDVVGPYNLANTRAHYGGNDSGGDDLLAGDMIVEACKAADADGVDFTLYNNDGDSNVDFVYVIYAGEGEADSDEDDAIWPHNWTLSSARYYNNCSYSASQSKVDGLSIENYACSGELRGRSTTRCPIGTIAHEFGHVLGLPDYYVTSDKATNAEKDYTPGAWHIMDYGSYNNDGRTPPNYSPHDKLYFGWYSINTSSSKFLAKDAKANGTLTTTYGSWYQITGTTSSATAKSTSRVWYLENRQKSGWDRYLPGHGMVVWEVQYNSSNWTGNTPNNTSVGYTVVTANSLTRPYEPYVDNTTASSTSGTTFPGTSNVTSYTPATGCALTNITESAGNITFKYNGGVVKTRATYEFLTDHCTAPAEGDVAINDPLSVTITPNSGYTLDDPSCWTVEMGGVELTYGTDFTYNPSNGNFYIASLTDDVVIMAEGKKIYTVTWSVQGINSTTTFADGAALVLPDNPSDCSGVGGKKFVGWTASSSVDGSAPADLFTASGTKTVTANTTYYAVYAMASGSGGSSKTYNLVLNGNNFAGSYNERSSSATANEVGGTGTLSVSFTSIGVMKSSNSGNPIQFRKSSSGAGVLYNTTDLGTINSITYGSGSTNNIASTYKGATEQPTSDGTGGYFKITNGSSVSYITSITINFTKSTGSGTSYSDYSLTCTTCTLSSIALTTSGVKTTFVTNETFTSEGLVVTASYSDCASKTVTPNSVSTPDMSSAGAKTVTVSYTEGEVTRTDTYNITVVAPKTVTYMACGDVFTTQEYAPGATLVLPTETPGANAGMVFEGWTATERYTGVSAPALISAGSAVNANATYYAVFH